MACRSRPAQNLVVDRNTLHAQGCQFLHKIQGRFHHQVHIQRLPGQSAHGADHPGTKGDGRHKMAVHNIDVEGIRPSGIGSLHVPGQMGKICCQN